MNCWFLLSTLFSHTLLFCGGTTVSKTQFAMWIANIILSLTLYSCGHITNTSCCDPCYNHLTFAQRLCVRQIQVHCDVCVYKNHFDNVSCKCRYEEALD